MNILSAILTVCIFLGCFTVGSNNITVNAAAPSGHLFITDDLADVPIPEVADGEIQIVDGFAAGALNSSDINLDVETGEHYPYLDEKSKKLYRALLKASTDVARYGTNANDVPISRRAPIELNSESAFTYSQLQFQDAYEAVRFDHPELVQLTMCSILKTIVTVYFPDLNETRYSTYYVLRATSNAYNQARFDEMTGQIRAKRTQILSDPKVAGAQGVLEKELAIHDLLLEMNEYDYAGLNSGSAYHLGHTAYGALVRGTSVCDGYAMALTYLLDGAGIKSAVITGMAGAADGLGGHAWNIVELNGNWYEVDSTWNDREDDEAESEAFLQAARHIFYHLTTSSISNHSYSISVDGYSEHDESRRERDGFSMQMPVAAGGQYSYENVLALIGGGNDIENGTISNLSISPESITDSVGTAGSFTASITPADTQNVSLVWTSSNENVISVDQSGNYTVTGTGVATVTVRSRDGLFRASALAVITDDEGNVPTGRISLLPGAIDGRIGDTGVIDCTVGPDSASNKNYSFVSSDSDIVAVSSDPDGIGYEIKWYGTACIVVTSDDGESEGYCFVKVPEVWNTVSFDTNGVSGTVRNISVLEYGLYGTLPLAPEKLGYDFAGWYTAAAGGSRITENSRVSITGNHTLYAHWTPKEYTVTFGGNGGTINGRTSVSGTYTYGQEVDPGNIDTPVRDGYSFDGWYDAPEGGNRVGKFNISAARSIFAHWVQSVSDTSGEGTGTVGTEDQGGAGGDGQSATGTGSGGAQSGAGSGNSGDQLEIGSGVGQGSSGVGDDQSAAGTGSGDAQGGVSAYDDGRGDAGSNENGSSSAGNAGENSTGTGDIGMQGASGKSGDTTSDMGTPVISGDSTQSSNPQATGDTEGQGDARDKNSAVSKAGTVLISANPEINGRFEVISSDTGSASVTYKEQSNKRASKVTIPKTISDGRGAIFKVTNIGAKAFYKNSKLRSVTIPSTVEAIRKNAFRGCSNLGNIRLNGNGLKSVKAGAFKGISKNAKFTIIARNKKIYRNIVEKVKKAGADTSTFRFKKG